jgi:FkbM family methyltransferase
MSSPHAPNDTTSPFWNTRYGIAAAVATDNVVARSLQLYGEWAEHETNLLSGLVEEGRSVLEFGGDFAAHALWMARAVGPHGQVHVVEPRRIRFQQLCANVALNRLDNVFTHPAWLDRGPGVHSPGGKETVRAITIDSLQLESVQLMKFNLADTLIEALAGATGTLREHRPLLYVRLSGMDKAAAEVAAMKALGYRVWSHVPYLYNSDNHAGIEKNIFPGIVQQNAIAAPADSHFEFGDRLEL